MSWNESSSKDTTRAIALCDSAGYFNCAINTQREDMGKKDENGVYERKWWDDYAVRNGYREATNEEVALYLRYVRLQEAVGEEMDIKCIITNYNTQVVCEWKKPTLWDRIMRELFLLKVRFEFWLNGKVKYDLPF